MTRSSINRAPRFTFSQSSFGSLGLAFLFIFLASFQVLQAQAYRMERFGIDQGLKEGYIYTITQDQKGFLWLGTGEDLIQFDGDKFRVFDEGNGVAAKFISSSLVDSKGNIWFGHYDGHITRYDGIEFGTVSTDSTDISSITDIQEDGKGNIWFATQRNGLIKINPEGELSHFKKGFENRLIFNFTFSPSGAQYMGTDTGLVEFKITNAGKPEITRYISRIPETKIQSIIAKSDSVGYWIGTEDEGFLEYIPGDTPEGDSVKQFSTTNGFKVDNIQSLFEDDERNLWVGTFGQGFLKYTYSGEADYIREIRQVSMQDSLKDEIIKSIFQDKYGQMWLGTYGNGIVKLTGEIFTLFQPINESESVIANILSVLEDSKGNVWFGTDSGLYFVRAEKVYDHGFNLTTRNGMPLQTERRYSIEDGMPGNGVTALFEDVDGTIWVGFQQNGVAKINPETGVVDTVEMNALALTSSVNAISADLKGNIWVATKGGAYMYDKALDQFYYYSTRNKLPHNNIYDIYPDSKGNIWFATHTNRLSYLQDGEFTNISIQTENGKVPNVMCITEDNNGKIWLGTDGDGIFRYDGEHFEQFTEEDGLVSNYCYVIIANDENNIWVGHRNGVTRYIQKTDKMIGYDYKGAYPLKETNINSVYKDKGGNLWFGTTDGAIQHNSFRDRSDVPPPNIFITGFQVFDEYFEMTEGRVLPYNVYRIRFDYLGLTFVNQSDVQYEFMLEGNDLEWSDYTQSTSFTYQGLRQGTYTFKVRATNRQGLRNEEPATFSFTIADPFWQSWWFLILLAILIIALILGLIRYRTYRLKREKEALEAIVEERTSELREEKEKVESANLELEKLSLVARETDNAVFILDKNGNLEWINEGFSRMTGMSLEDLAERGRKDGFINTSSNENFKKLLDEAVQENKSVMYESTLPSKKGDIIWVISNLTPILDKDGSLKKIVIIDSDITERKRAEQLLKQMNEELEQLVAERTQELAEANEQLVRNNERLVETADQLRLINKELDTFVYRASHDLKQPVASLVGLVTITKMETKEASAQTYLELMEKTTAKLDNILTDMLEAVQVKQNPIKLEDLNLNEMVDRILQRMDMTVPHIEKVNLEVDIPENLVFHTDYDLFSAIISNYVENAVKYRDDEKDKPFVQISVKEKGEGIGIEVKDNGRGISEESQSKVFDMFFKDVELALSDGTGLGLYIVRNAADRLKGYAEVESELGKGSTFSCYLPIQKPIVAKQED